MHRSLSLILICALLAPLTPVLHAQAPGLTIPQIQGPGPASPYDGQQLSAPLVGCVTGVAAEGFYLQDPTGDGDAATSDGIYVYRYGGWRNPRQLKPGDLVEIRHYRVQEFYGQTELSGLSNDKASTYRLLGSCTLPPPAHIEPPVDPQADLEVQYERVEGQLVVIDLDASVVGPTQRYESRYEAGDPEITVAQRGSPYFGGRPFAGELPVDRGTLALSGGLGFDLPVANTFDRVTAAGLTGVLTYQFGRYVLLVTDPAPLRVVAADAVAAAAGADAVAADAVAADAGAVLTALIAEPPAGDDEWTACTWNAENLFDAVDDGDGDVGDWSPSDQRAYRAAVDARARLLREVLGGCTVVGLQELEGKDAVWADVARALGPTYGFDYWESADVRDLSVGLLYDSARVELRRSAAAPLCGPVDYGVDVTAERGGRVWQSECPIGSYPLYDRPPYVADLVVASAAGDRHIEVRAVVVHLKSKRGDESVNLGRRIEQARHVRSLLDAPLAIGLGDFNDDLGSETMREMAGLVNVYGRHAAPLERYSYVYQGRAQAMDHVVMTEELDRTVVRGGPVHVNADRGETVDPTDPAARSSDHDPLLVRFAFRPTAVSDVLVSAACGALQPLLPLEVDDQSGGDEDHQ